MHNFFAYCFEINLLFRFIFIIFSFFLSSCGPSFDSKLLSTTGVSEPAGNSTGTGTPNSSSQSFSAFDSEVIYDQVIYVSNSAPVGGDGSRNSPFQTISINHLVPGNDIVLLPGIYSYPSSLFRNIQGTLTRPIRVRGLGQVGDVRIDGTNQQANGLTFSDVKYFVLENITIENTYYHGINIDDGGSYATPSEFIVFRNLVFNNIGRVAGVSGSGNLDCLKISGVHNFWILNSNFNNCKYQGNTAITTDDATGELIDMVGGHYGIIAGNSFTNVLYNGVQTKGGSGDILITGNTFRNIQLRSVNIGGNTDPNLVRPIDANFEARNIKVIGNQFESSGWATATFEACHFCIFANNTVINPVGRLFYMLNTTRNSVVYQTQAPVVRNNIIYFDSSQLNTIVALPGMANLIPSATGSILSNNLFYAFNNASFSPNLNYFESVQNNLMQTNPQFSNEGYALGISSPARGVGFNLYNGFDGYYFNGNRIQGSINLGAY